MRFAKKLVLNSLTIQLFLAYLFGFVMSFILVIFSAYWLLTSQNHYFIRHDIASLTKQQAQKILFNAQNQPIGFDIPDQHSFLWLFDSLKREAAYRILDQQGRSLLQSPAGKDFWQPSMEAHQLKLAHFKFNNQDTLIYGATVKVQHQGQSFYLQLAVSARLHQLIHQGFAFPFMSMAIIWFSLILLLVLAGSTYLILKHTLKPLTKISESAARISIRSMHDRLQLDHVPSELVPLVDSFNRVLERLEQGYRNQQEFLATTAHELKTPLALIRGQIELAPPSAVRQSLLNDVQHMSRQIQQLLLLSEVTEGQNYSLRYLSINQIVEDTVLYLQPISQRSQIQFKTRITAQRSWYADQSALFILLKNLLENAIQHAPQGSEIHINIDDARITIRDHGLGVAPEDLEKLFLRFWRGAHRRDHGAGLGLAICQEIVQAHGWQLSAHNAQPGLCFILQNVAAKM
jgi:signal transduction histidine kinase